MNSREGRVEFALGVGALCGALSAIGGLFILLFVVAGIVAACISLAAFFMCCLAWDSPRRFGPVSIEPFFARAFIKGGLTGAFLLAGGLTVLGILLGGRFSVEGIFYLAVMGQLLGSSIGVATAKRLSPTPSRSAQTLTPAPEPERSTTARPSFHFATWDDEETRR